MKYETVVSIQIARWFDFTSPQPTIFFKCFKTTKTEFEASPDFILQNFT